MKYPKFFKAPDLGGACDYLSMYRGKAKILAGGTDLMVSINRRVFIPETILFIGDLDLSYVKEEEGSIVIGALTTHDTISRSKTVNEKLPLLAECVKSIGSPAIRNMGTIGGNLVNASPAADSAVGLLALRAKVKLTSKKSSRVVNLDEFFQGPGKTILGGDELVEEVIVPLPDPDAKWGWRKMGQRKAETCSVVSAAVLLEKQGDVCREIKICLGSVAPTPLVAAKAEALAGGKSLSQQLIMELADVTSRETNPIDDARATAWYRRKISAALVRQLLGDMVG